MHKDHLKYRDNDVPEIEETQNDFENEIASHENITLEEIENCSTSMKMDLNNAELENHVNKSFVVDDSNEEIKLECDNCDEEFLSQIDLKRHMQFATDPFLCGLCYLKFCTSKGLEKHIEKVHFFTQEEDNEPEMQQPESKIIDNFPFESEDGNGIANNEDDKYR